MGMFSLNLENDDVIPKIIDRNEDMSSIIKEVAQYWNFDFSSRAPGSAYVDNQFVGTDLDLCCFLFSISQRKPVIKIPYYDRRREKTIKKGQVQLTNERYGKLHGIGFANDTFS